jgi:hypothetical protein
MSIYIDADAVVRWEKGQIDLLSWLNAKGSEPMAIPATVWQQFMATIAIRRLFLGSRPSGKTTTLPGSHRTIARRTLFSRPC